MHKLTKYVKTDRNFHGNFENDTVLVALGRYREYEEYYVSISGNDDTSLKTDVISYEEAKRLYDSIEFVGVKETELFRDSPENNGWPSKLQVFITREYLRANPNHILVFGDNYSRKGTSGAAILRDEPNTYGFITKRKEDHEDDSFFKPEEYLPVFERELQQLINIIKANPDNKYLISPVGSGVANKYDIFYYVIKDRIRVLEQFPNVEFLY